MRDNTFNLFLEDIQRYQIIFNSTCRSSVCALNWSGPIGISSFKLQCFMELYTYRTQNSLFATTTRFFSLEGFHDNSPVPYPIEEDQVRMDRTSERARLRNLDSMRESCTLEREAKSLDGASSLKFGQRPRTSGSLWTALCWARSKAFMHKELA